MKGTFKSLKNFQVEYCGSSGKLSAFIENGKQSLIAKVNLGQTRLSPVSENYTLPEHTNKPGYEGTFCME